MARQRRTRQARPSHPAPRAVARRAIGRSPDQSRLIHCSLKCSPRCSGFVNIIAKNGVTHSMHGNLALSAKAIQLLQQYLP